MLRVVSWNVRSLRDDGRGVAEVLRDMRPDVVVLQEAPRLLLWRTSRALLARRAGLRLVTRGRTAGNLLLAGPETGVEAAWQLLLPRRPRLHRRAAVLARVHVDGRPLVVAGTHLDLEPAARLDSARRVRAGLPALPVVLCADVNEDPGGPAWKALAAGLLDAGAECGPTFSVTAPRRRIDALLVDPALEVAACRVVPVGPVSDHLPLCADLRWQ